MSVRISGTLRRVLFVAVLWGLGLQAAHAQFDTATVLGTIRDATGAVLPGVEVTLRNVRTGVTATTVSNEAGNYQFLTVRVGVYTVSAELPGFSTAVAEDVTVSVAARQRVDLVMQIGEITERVTVLGAAQLLEADSSDRGQVIASDQIVNLPLNARAYSDLALLSPGVRRSAIAGSREGSFNVHGQRSAFNNFVLDGVDNNAYGTSNQGFANQVVQASPDAIAEFRVQTNNYSAEYGRAVGAVVNASFASGTNAFRGSVWEFHRNTVLNAVGFFKPARDEKPTLLRNQFGFTFGGPIRRDRTFFFVHYEGFRQGQRSLNFISIPPMEMRQGILGTPIRHPLTGELFADGVIPESQITPMAKTYLSLLPVPQHAGRSNNYESLRRVDNNTDKGDVKIDHVFSPAVNGFVRVSHRKSNGFEDVRIPLPLGDPVNWAVLVINQQVAGGVTYTLSPTSLVEFRFGASKTLAGKDPHGLGTANMFDMFGITGLPTQPPIAGGYTAQNVSGFTSMGRQTSNPQWQDPYVYNPKVNFSTIMGRHSLKLGYEYQAINTEIEDWHPKYGSDSYSGQFSRPPGGTAHSSIYNLADFMFGARSRYELMTYFPAQYRQRMHFWYVQNDIRVTPRMALNVGLRYEFATPQWEKNNDLMNFDPTSQTLVRAQSGSIADRALVNPDRNNFAPRLGLAYTITPTTVVRSGFGISYIHFNRAGGENILSWNNVAALDYNQIPGQGLCSDPGADPSTCFRPTPMGYPEGQFGPRVGALDSRSTRVNFIPRDNPTGYVQSWHLTIQRELAQNLMLDLGYIGSGSAKLMLLGDYNQARPNELGENTVLRQRRPLPAFDFIQIAFPGGTANYHAFQAKLERRFSQGLYLLNSFTWSKAIDLAAGHLEVHHGDSSRVNWADTRADRGPSNYDQPFNNTTTFIWDVPVGRGRNFGTDMAPVLEAVLGGWRLTGINTMSSGRRVNLRYSPASQGSVSGAPAYRPELVGDPILPKDQRTIDNFFNRDALKVPLYTQPFGNAGRNIALSDAFYQLDLGLHKSFNLPREATRLEFRSEFFNFFNKTNFAPPTENISSTAFGTIRSTYQPREIQFGLKLYF
jgi:hypothetical protein